MSWYLAQLRTPSSCSAVPYRAEQKLGRPGLLVSYQR